MGLRHLTWKPNYRTSCSQPRAAASRGPNSKPPEGEIDTLQTGLAAATAAGTTQLTVADLTAAKTNTKNLVTA